MKKIITLLTLILGLILTSCGSNEGIYTNTGSVGDADTKSGAQSYANDGDAKIDFSGMSAELLSGETFDFADSIESNKVCIINVWATFCGPCIEEMPELNEIFSENAGDIGVVGICMDCADASGNVDDEILANAVKIAGDDLKLSYPVVIPSEEMMTSFLRDVMAVPVTYIVDDKGTVLESFYGKRSKEQFLEIAQRYISKE